MSGKERRDTFLTVNFPSDGAVAVGPGAYVSTVKVPMEHMEQILKMPRTDMHANIKSLSLEDATHADADGVAAFKICLNTTFQSPRGNPILAIAANPGCNSIIVLPRNNFVASPNFQRQLGKCHL